MLIDTHAHLNFNAFKNDAEGVIKRTLENDIWVINIGTKYETSKRAVEIAQRYPQGIFAAIGLHPIHLETGLVKIKNDLEEIEVKTREEQFDYQKYKELARNEKVVAIGEIGLDYYYKPKTKRKLEIFKEKQKTILCQQLDLAKDLNLPVIFHCRMAHDDLIEVLKLKMKNEKLKINGVIHCFTGNWGQAEEFLNMGFYLGFNGIIFKLNLDEIIKKTPLDRILTETDCPYLMPPIGENQRIDQRKSAAVRNEPLFVKYVAEKIAKIKKISYEEIAEITTNNAKKLFSF